jgi:hypothetical protein
LEAQSQRIVVRWSASPLTVHRLPTTLVRDLTMVQWAMTQTTSSKTKTKRPGDSLIGLGGMLSVLGLILAFMTASTATSIALALSLTLGGLLLVVIGYLKRIAVALELQRGA